jgi:hypothetical protein
MDAYDPRPLQSTALRNGGIGLKLLDPEWLIREAEYPDIHFDFLGFQFRARKIMWVKSERAASSHRFQPAASPTALTRIGRDIRGWALHHRSDKSLTELAQMYNPCIRGWIVYYSHFYKTQLRPMPMSSGGRVASSSRCATRPKVGEIGLTGSAAPTRHSSLIGRYAMATAEHREPCESKGSCTVLGAAGGESPPGDSTIATDGCATKITP